jgi:chemotaxis regulatin CheY-phosphate phosphatase CheZ
MSKRVGLKLSDDTHAQVKQRADAAGLSVHSWIVAAIERENFRQLCHEVNQWWSQHPEAAQHQVADYHQREDLRENVPADRGPSAA